MYTLFGCVWPLLWMWPPTCMTACVGSHLLCMSGLRQQYPKQKAVAVSCPPVGVQRLGANSFARSSPEKGTLNMLLPNLTRGSMEGTSGVTITPFV